jgi:hypothetical protein
LNKDGTFSGYKERVYDSGNTPLQRPFWLHNSSNDSSWRLQEFRIRFTTLTKKNQTLNLRWRTFFHTILTPHKPLELEHQLMKHGLRGGRRLFIYCTKPVALRLSNGYRRTKLWYGQITLLAATASSGTISYKWYTTLTGGVPIQEQIDRAYTTPSSLSTTTPYCYCPECQRWWIPS